PREMEIYDNETDVEFVNDGDTIRLLHLVTESNLHSHKIPAPLTRAHWEVSCYGNDTFGDEKDSWVIEVVDDVYKRTNHIRSLTTIMRLRHKALGCYLRAANVGLPDWGFRQVEVTCDKRNNPKDTYTHWNIERHWNSKLPPGGKANYKSKFLREFWNLNVAMYNANNALVSDPDDYDILASKPRQWPILEVGLRLCSWTSDSIKFYLLGNPAVWWSGTASLMLFILTLFWYLVRRQRQYTDFSPAQWTYFLYVGFLMDQFTASCSLKTKNMIFGIHYALIITIFWYFKDIAYGVSSPNIELKDKKWLSTWDIVD
ncbi:5513_t:CDS:2, partial [Funneliformis caledonium]